MEACEAAIKKSQYKNCKDYMKILRKGCNLGSGYCRASLGNEFHPIAQGTVMYGRDCSLRNEDEAFKYYKKACDLGESQGCRRYTQLGLLLQQIETRERDKIQKSDITIRLR